MEPGKFQWATSRMSGLSMPRPNALVAITARSSPDMKRRCVSSRSETLSLP